MLFGLLLTRHFVLRKILVKLDYTVIMKSVVPSGAMALIMEALQLPYYSRFAICSSRTSWIPSRVAGIESHE
jgi:hypothetical protein